MLLKKSKVPNQIVKKHINILIHLRTIHTCKKIKTTTKKKQTEQNKKKQVKKHLPKKNVFFTALVRKFYERRMNDDT